MFLLFLMYFLIQINFTFLIYLFQHFQKHLYKMGETKKIFVAKSYLSIFYELIELANSETPIDFGDGNFFK